MKKIKYAVFIVLVFLLLIYGKQMMFRLTFYYNGIKVNSISYCVDPYLCADIEINKNGKKYQLTITNLKLSQLYSNGSILISHLNGYRLQVFGCSASYHKKVRNTKTNKFKGYRWMSNSICLGNETLIGDYFGYKFSNIS